jgi:class 3 adenylate cyclase
MVFVAARRAAQRVKHGDHMFRPATAAVRIQESLDLMNAQMDGVRVALGIGVATGTALATNMGSVSCSDYTMVGDTINTASRLQGKLAPSEMSVTAEGYQSISSFFPAAIRMEYLFRGPAQPVPAYRLARALSVIRQTATSDGHAEAGYPSGSRGRTQRFG